MLAGHVWVYDSEIGEVRGSAEDGGIVDVLDSRGRFVGRGTYNGRSRIPVRLVTRKAEPVDKDFWRRRVQTAWGYRRETVPDREAERVVAGEADGLPGLIVDRYGDHLVFQTTTLAMDRRLDTLVPILCETVPHAAVIERNQDLAVRRLEGLPPRGGLVHGMSDGRVEVRIGRGRFVCHLLDRQKTGYYLDQQENYVRAMGFVRPGDRVLDAFCFEAGFGIHALLAGAARALGLDSSEAALEDARASASLSGVADRLETRVGNAFDLLRALDKAGERFDFVVLDPPSFTRNKAAVEAALRGYREIHVRALRLLPPGGRLLTFCCSHHVSGPVFRDMIAAAASDARATLRLEATFGAASDHPVLLGVPETEYLKGFALTVLENVRTQPDHAVIPPCPPDASDRNGA